MALKDNDWREEQQRVNIVTAKVEQEIARLESELGQVRTDVVEFRKNFWDEVSINLSNWDDLVETHFAIRQQAQVLSEHERRFRQSTTTLKTYRKLAANPWFGRIDFYDEALDETESIYIGIGSFREDDGTFWVYDWRAPISSLYYDYGPGPAKYQAPAGEITGEVTLKRQYVIRGGTIHLMFDTGVTIGDELLMEALSRHSDAQMKGIVATIQKEQNRIIRNERGRMLLVQGPAGSGKTSAALQRVAYLLYKYRDFLKADQVVLLSPNPLFNSYVSTVLPELGEENMQQTTFHEYLERRLGREFQLEDPFSQMEYLLTRAEEPGYDTRVAGIRYKSSRAFVRVLHNYQELLCRKRMRFRSVVVDDKEIVAADRMEETFYGLDPSLRMIHRVEFLREWLLQQIDAAAEQELSEPWVEDAIQLLSPEDYQRAYRELRREQHGKSATFNDFDREQEILARMVVRRKYKPVRRWIQNLQFIDSFALYRQLFADTALFTELVGEQGLPENWDAICRQTLTALDNGALCSEDATPYLYLKELVQGLHTNTTIRHVFVDEAQDYTPFQLEFLKKLFPRAKMTALGDLNQAIYAHGSVFHNVAEMTELYGADQTEVIRLSQSYRSTQEIVEFTRGMVPGGEEIVPFHRHGEKPLVVSLANSEELHRELGDRIHNLEREGFGSIAVICKTAEESAQVSAVLGSQVSHHLITKRTPTFEKGTMVIPSYLAKGVEFDAVILYDGSRRQYHRESERKLFYTACTRAMHRLYVLCLGAPSAFITSQSPATYDVVGDGTAAT